MASFSSLKFSHKLVMGGVIGTCCGVFFLNGASDDLRRRRFKDADKLVQSGRVPPQAFQIVGGDLIIPPELRQAGKSFNPRPFLDNTWTPKFVTDQLSLNLNNWNQGRWYTIFTSGFNHSGPGHLFFNMIALVSIAPVFLVSQGTRTFITLWATSAVAGGLPTLWKFNHGLKTALQAENPDMQTVRRYATASAIGASSSIMGLFGAAAVLFPRMNWQIMLIPYPIPARILLGFTLGGSLLADSLGLFPGIGHWAHIGGMVNGILYGLFLQRGQPVRGAAMFAVLTCSALHKSVTEEEKSLEDPV